MLVAQQDAALRSKVVGQRGGHLAAGGGDEALQPFAAVLLRLEQAWHCIKGGVSSYHYGVSQVGGTF